MAIMKTDLTGLREKVATDRTSFIPDTTSPQKQKAEPFPMFLPVATRGKPVMQVQSRQDFMNHNIGEWRLYHLTRASAVLAGIGALWLFPINVYASVASGIAAGWLYGEHLKKNFYINNLLKSRDLLEST